MKSRPRSLASSLDAIIKTQKESKKPLAIVLAGHNGSGKSTLWYKRLADSLKLPLINADRMMLSILPEVADRKLTPWAAAIRDSDEAWMSVAQKGVQAFIGHAMAQKVAFATETVFSHWRRRADGSYESKIDTIKELQAAGYFVLLIFVGLANVGVSIGRVATRKSDGGHDVDGIKLRERFPRTQQAIHAAIPVANAALLTDNSHDPDHAFVLVRAQLGTQVLFDIRSDTKSVSPLITEWLDVVCPAA